MGKQSVTMASATESDIQDMYKLMHILEAMKDELPRSVDDFDHLEFDKKEKNLLSQIFNEDGEIEIESFVHYLNGLCHGFYRVVMGYEVLYDNTADKRLSYLAFNSDILESIELWNQIEEKLKAGETVTITPTSEIGIKILLHTKEKEVANG